MEVNVTLYADYGYVLLAICSSWFLLNWLESRTFQARRRYEVPELADLPHPPQLCVGALSMQRNVSLPRAPQHTTQLGVYPKMYTEPYTHVFNCIQRAHQNTLEGYPLFLVLLIFGGILYPKLSAVCGMLWIASRVVYAIGYYSGDPERRKYGSFGYLGLLILLINNVILALKLLGYVSM